MRLCVETGVIFDILPTIKAAAFVRLCVETLKSRIFDSVAFNAAAFGWLCVETSRGLTPTAVITGSRFHAAVC